MQVPGGIGLVARFQALDGVLAYRLQHAEPRFFIGLAFSRNLQEVLIEQHLQEVEYVGLKIGMGVAYSLHRRESATPNEYAQPGEQKLFLRGQQVVAPGYGVSQRLVA